MSEISCPNCDGVMVIAEDEEEGLMWECTDPDCAYSEVRGDEAELISQEPRV